MKKRALVRPLFLNSLLSFALVSALPCLLASPAVATYEELLSAIRQIKHAAQARIEQAAQQEKVREAWETGKRIDEHILQNKKRAEYGDQVIVKLARDLGSNETELRFMLQFARTYPIHRPANELTWSHYQSLLALNDPKEREEVTEKAQKENWTRDRVREEVRKRKAAKGEREPAPEPKLAPLKLGKPYTYKIVRARTGPLRGKLVIDLGFSNYFDIRESSFAAPGSSRMFQENEVIEVDFSDKYSVIKGSAEDLYTYQAYVSHVIDGDTFVVVIDLGFGVWTTQKLRLRGLDAPEIVTKEGKEAKAFLEKMIEDRTKKIEKPEGSTLTSNVDPLSPVVLIRTTKSDKYDRYLVDAYVPASSLRSRLGGKSNLDSKYIYINQQLIDEGLAVVVHE